MRRSLTAELLDLSVESGDAVARFEALQLAFSVGLQLCDGAWTRSAVAESASLIDKVGDVGRRWSLSYQSAALAHLDGDLARAEELAEEGLAIFGAVSPSRSFAAYGAEILVIRIAQHRVSELAGTIAVAPRSARSAGVERGSGVGPGRERSGQGCWIRDPGFRGGGKGLHLAGITSDRRTCGGSHRRSRTEPQICGRVGPILGLGCWQGTCSYGPVDLVLWQLHRSLWQLHCSVSQDRQMAREASDRLAAPVFLAELDV